MEVRVLLVDDSREVRALYRRLVAGDEEIRLVGEAVNGHEAIEMVGDLAPDVVVMDVQMPVLDGVEATRKIKEQWPEVSVLGCTADENRTIARSMACAGATAHIDKANAGTLLVPLLKALGSVGGPAEGIVGEHAAQDDPTVD